MTDEEGPFLVELDGEYQCKMHFANIPEGWTLVGYGPSAVPIDWGVWDGDAWRIPLGLLKIWKWDEIKAVRDATRYGGFMTAKGKMDSDPESQRKIGGAVSMAMMLGENFSIDWTMFDNTPQTFNAAEMQAAGIALGMFEGQCHAIGRALRDQIEAATTPEELEAITWPA